MRRGIVRRERHRTPKQRLAFGRATLLGNRHAQQLAESSVIAMAPEEHPVLLFRLPQPPRLMVLNSGSEQRVVRRHHEITRAVSRRGDMSGH